MTQNNHKLITIIGNVGSGKSTLTDLLAKKLNAIKVPADELYKTNPFFSLTVKDRKRWSLASDLWFLVERVKLAQKYPHLLKKNNVVVDSGIQMSWVYANSRLRNGYYTIHEWNLYKTYYRTLTADLIYPDVIVYLKAPETFLLERIRKRGREFEVRYFDRRYLFCLKKSIGELLKTLDRTTKIIIHDKQKLGNLPDIIVV